MAQESELKTGKLEFCNLQTEGTEGDWEQVLRQTLPSLRAFMRMRLGQDCDVEDCLQIVAVQAIDRGQDVLPAARRAWLFRVAANESARFYRRQAATQKMQQRHEASQTSSPEPTNDPAQQILLQEEVQAIRQQIRMLPETTREIIRLRIEQDLTFQQIADQLQIPLGTALTSMRRAMEKIRRSLRDTPQHNED